MPESLPESSKQSASQSPTVAGSCDPRLYLRKARLERRETGWRTLRFPAAAPTSSCYRPATPALHSASMCQSARSTGRQRKAESSGVARLEASSPTSAQPSPAFPSPEPQRNFRRQSLLKPFHIFGMTATRATFMIRLMDEARPSPSRTRSTRFNSIWDFHSSLLRSSFVTSPTHQ